MPALTALLRSALMLLLLCLAPMAMARCDTPTSFTPEVLANLRAEAATAPFHKGLLWQVEKAGVTSYLFGTMHIHDPRHAASMERIKPLIAASAQVLVEVTEAEEAALQKDMATNSARYLITEGPSLIDRLGPEDWETLKTMVEARGMPGFMAARMQPWFLGFSLMLPPCAQQDLQAGLTGIDKTIEAFAVEQGKHVQSLDDVNALIDFFAQDPLDQQVEDLRWSLQLGLPLTPDLNGIVDFYFNEETQLAWPATFQTLQDVAQHLTTADRTKLEGITREMLEGIITGRNLQWMQALVPELEATPSFVAVGALHLPGEQGLLNALQQAGFSITPLPLS